MAEYAVGVATKARIFQAAKELFYERGVADTSYTDIAQRADANRGLIPYHFKNKTNLCIMAVQEFLDSMVAAVEQRWPTSEVPPYVQNILVELFQFRLLSYDSRFLRFYSEVVDNWEFHDAMFGIQADVVLKMTQGFDVQLSDDALRSITCMMTGTETELVLAMRSGYLTEPVEAFVRRDLLWVYFLLGIDTRQVGIWCDEAYALAEGLTMTCSPTLECAIVPVAE